MKFLLIRPPVSLAIARSFHAFLHLEPLDLEIVAGGIDEKHETRILDLTVTRRAEKRFEKELRSFKPDVIGFGGYSNQSANVKNFAAQTKSILPDSLTIVGGVHATISPETMKIPGVIDVVVRGEGATALQRLVAALEAGEEIPADDTILPVSSPLFDELAAKCPPLIPSYDQVPLPRRELLNHEDYFCVTSGDVGERMETIFPQVTTMRTSTGCPYHCSFCVVHYLANRRYLQREPQDVVDEIKTVDSEVIYFVDDEMFINAERTREIAELLIEQGIKKKYISWARADTICKNEELFRLWKKAGLHVLYVGLESMQPENLEDYNKGIDPDTNRGAVEMLRKLDIQLHAALMVNPDFVEEDFEKVRSTIDSLAPAEITFTVFSPSPGTPLWKEHRDEFICEDPYAFYDCMHSILPTKLPMNTFYKYFSLLYLFAFRNNPWRLKKNKAPMRDVLRLLISGMQCGWQLRHIYKAYDRSRW